MSQDLRKLMRTEEDRSLGLPEGHEERFTARLDRELHTRKSDGFGWSWIGIAASVVMLAGIYIFWQASDSSVPASQPVVNANHAGSGQEKISLGDLSPELQRIETYYVANINMALADLPAGSEHKTLVEGYMDRLIMLNKAYKGLQEELNQDGPNDQVINALIENLQMRLKLLQNLKVQLNQLNTSYHENEQII